MVWHRYCSEAITQHPRSSARKICCAKRGYQKGIGAAPVPPVCVIDPDGDIVDHVRRHHGARASARMWEWTAGGIHFGIVGRAVGSSFSVLVAEQLFASGCELLLSVASAGQIADIAAPPYHILITRALRDEGTSLGRRAWRATSGLGRACSEAQADRD